MEKTRIYELAKEMNVDNKVLLAKLDEMQVPYKNHMSSVSNEVAQKLRDSIGNKQKAEAKTKPVTDKAENNEKIKNETAEKIMQNKPNENKPETRENRVQRTENREGNRPLRDGERPVRDGQRPPRDPNRQPRDGERPIRDGQRPPRDPNRPPRDGERPVRDGQRPPRDPNRPPRDPNRPPRDGERPIRDGQRPPRDPNRPPRDGERPIRDGQRPPRDPNRPPRDGQRPPRDPNRPPRDGQRPPRDPNRPPRDGQRVQNKDYNNRPYREGERPNRENRDRRAQNDRPAYNPAEELTASAIQAELMLNSDRHELKEAVENLQKAQQSEAQWAKSTQNGGKVRNEKPVKNNNRDRDNEDEFEKKWSGKNKKNDTNYKENQRFGKNKKAKKAEAQPPKEFAEVKHHVVIEESITVQDLARQLSKKSAEVIMKLMSMGVMATINQELDIDTATIIAEEFGATVEVKVTKEEELLVDIPDDPADLVTRPPVVTIMGHVDHGKTSLLDKIRSSNVTASEAGGITQHIGAYQVEINSQKITFLDTPGHEAFTAMRARGAQVTDIAILVVAADDGVMPQTIEAIDHAKAAEVPIIVAINKIDKPSADPDKIKQELTNHGLVAEDWGGDAIMVPVSAKSGQGINDLLEMILLVAEVQELKANPNRNAKGKVVESKLDRGRGPVATLLVQNGTLYVGDFLIVGTTQGRIRAMFDYKGKAVKMAPPSMPVEILGLSEVPEAGDDFIAVDNEKLAKQVAEKRQKDKHLQEISRNLKVSLEDIFAQIKEGEIKDLNIVLKADVQGSIEAIRQSLEKLSNDEVRVNIIRTAVGGIKEADVMLAAASNAIIIGFNVRPDANAKKLSEKENVEIKTYRVIYDAIEDVRAALSGMLAPEIKEVELGQAEVRNTFKVPKVGTIAGCYVTEGKITRNAKLRVVRDGVVILDGEIASLRRFKDDVKEVAAGYECGIGIDKFNDIKEGDVLEAYTFEEIKREL